MCRYPLQGTHDIRTKFELDTARPPYKKTSVRSNAVQAEIAADKLYCLT